MKILETFLIIILNTTLILSSKSLRYLSTEADLSHEHAIHNITSTFICKDNSYCSNNGLCIESKCICDEGKTTFINNFSKFVSESVYVREISMCNYTQKSRLTALMLCLFVGFGSEHFYMEKSDLGIAKLIFYLFCFVANILLVVIHKCYPEYKSYVDFIGKIESIYMVVGFIVCILWIIYDLVRIGNGSILDGNGIALKSW